MCERFYLPYRKQLKFYYLYNFVHLKADLPAENPIYTHCLIIFLSVWVCDSVAYIFGRQFGDKKIALSISPNKTWEGSAGGFTSSVGAALILGLLLDLGAPVWQQAVIGGVVGVVAQWGDLVESKLKRIADVKDSGSIIPGHGGLLDRLDSILLALPAVYFLRVTVFAS